MKRFKYLYFTNIINKPYFNFWFLKKLKGGEEDDGNLLSQPDSPFTHKDVTWTWDKMNATGVGTAGSVRVNMTNRLLLKEELETDSSYTFSIKEPLEGSKNNIVLALSNEDQSIVYDYMIDTTKNSVTFTPENNYTHFQLWLSTTRRAAINLTIEDIKLVKAS